MVLMRIHYIQITINKKIKVIAHVFVLDPVQEEMYYTINSYYKYTSIPKSSFNKINITRKR